MKTIEQIKQSAEYKAVMEIVRNNRLCTKRNEALRNAGYTIETKAMGSGGVGQVKLTKRAQYRVQVSYGTGKYNYAYCVTLKSNEQ